MDQLIYSIAQGEPGDDFYIIVDGSATVTQYRAEGEDSQEVSKPTTQILQSQKNWQKYQKTHKLCVPCFKKLLWFVVR